MSALFDVVRSVLRPVRPSFCASSRKEICSGNSRSAGSDDVSKTLPVPRGKSGHRAMYLTPQNATIEGAVSTSKPFEDKRPALTEHAADRDRLRRRASIGGFSTLLLVISWWLVPGVGCTVTIPAVLVLYGIVAPEPIDTYLDGNFDRHSHARW
jgi:hypothetical protein